jgi:hypothetical protein
LFTLPMASPSITLDFCVGLEIGESSVGGGELLRLV